MLSTLRGMAERMIFGRHRLIRVRSHLIRVRPTGRYAAFWNKYEGESWEQDTFDVLDRFLKPGSKYVDIGGWIGPTVLYGAACGASVTAFEPDLIAFKELRANVQSNPSFRRTVTLVNAAVSTEDGQAVLRSKKLGNSGSTLMAAKVSRKGRIVELKEEQACTTLSAEHASRAHDFHGADLIKIDIEGGEYRLLPALLPLLAGSKAALFVAFHPFNLGVGLPTPAETKELRSRLNLEIVHLLSGYEASRMVEGEWKTASTADLVRQSEDGKYLSGAILFQPR